MCNETGSKLHIVSKSKKGLLICDEACLAWKSQKLCSHVLAVAEERKCLDDFLTSYRTSKSTGNYTAVSIHNQPKNVGKKPGCPKRRAPSQYKKTDIDTYVVNPLSSGNHDVSWTTVSSESNCFLSNPSSLNNSVTPIALATSSQCTQLSALPSQPTGSVSSSQIHQLNLHPQNVTPTFKCSPLPVMAASRGTVHPTVVASLPFQVKIL